MHRLLGIFLILLLNFNVIVAGLQVGHYIYALEEYKERCINKENQEIKCDGMCHLQAEIAANTQTEESAPEAPSVRFEVVEFMASPVILPQIFGYLLLQFKSFKGVELSASNADLIKPPIV